MSAKNSNKKIFENIKKCKGIKKCEGTDNCFGMIRPPPLPVVLPNYGQAEIMVITEQPGPKLLEEIGEIEKMSEKEIEKLVAQDKNRWEKMFLSRFKHLFAEGKKVPGSLKRFLGKEFSEDVINGSGKYYWTHYIKCHGQIRKKGINERNKNACAEKHLIKEILTLKPDLILTFGSSSSKWLLKKSNEYKKSDWREHFWNEIVAVINAKNKGGMEEENLTIKLQKTSKPVTISGKDIYDKDSKHETRVLVFYHPSGANPAAYFTKKIFEILNPQKDTGVD